MPFFNSLKPGITTGIVTVFLNHIFFTSISRSSYLNSFLNSTTGTFLAAGTSTSIRFPAFSFLALLLLSKGQLTARLILHIHHFFYTKTNFRRAVSSFLVLKHDNNNRNKIFTSFIKIHMVFRELSKYRRQDIG